MMRSYPVPNLTNSMQRTDFPLKVVVVKFPSKINLMPLVHVIPRSIFSLRLGPKTIVLYPFSI